jgi:hypothetical protein
VSAKLHEDLLAQGPTTAPEAETAERRSRRLRMRGRRLGGAASVVLFLAGLALEVLHVPFLYVALVAVVVVGTAAAFGLDERQEER